MTPDATPAFALPRRSDYGADAHGLIQGFAFRAGEPARTLVDADETARRLAAGEGGFPWLHFDLSHAGALAWLRSHARMRRNWRGFDASRSGCSACSR